MADARTIKREHNVCVCDVESMIFEYAEVNVYAGEVNVYESSSTPTHEVEL